MDMVLRNLAPITPFVVRWQYPLFVREDSLDPSRLRQIGGRPAKYSPETLLEALGDQRLTSTGHSHVRETQPSVVQGLGDGIAGSIHGGHMDDHGC